MIGWQTCCRSRHHTRARPPGDLGFEQRSEGCRRLEPDDGRLRAFLRSDRPGSLRDTNRAHPERMRRFSSRCSARRKLRRCADLVAASASRSGWCIRSCTTSNQRCVGPSERGTTPRTPASGCSIASTVLRRPAFVVRNHLCGVVEDEGRGFVNRRGQRRRARRIRRAGVNQIGRWFHRRSRTPTWSPLAATTGSMNWW